MLFYLVVFVVVVVVAANLYMRKHGPKSVTLKMDSIETTVFEKMPPVWAMYLEVITSKYNFTKPSYPPADSRKAHIETLVPVHKVDKQQVANFQELCGYGDRALIPPAYAFPLGFHLIGYSLTSKLFPIKPFASLVHISQEIEALEPIGVDDQLSVRLLTKSVQGEKGTELHLVTYVYKLMGDGAEPNLVWRSVGIELAPSPKKKGKGGARKEFAVHEWPEEDDNTVINTWTLGWDAGRKYAAASSDYNPWHMAKILGQLFGHRAALSQGNYTLSQACADIENAGFCPPYPLRIKAEYKRPVNLPAKVKCTLTRDEDAQTASFDVYSMDGKSLHAVGKVEHIDDLYLSDERQ